MLICNEISFQAHCLGGCRSVSVAGSARGRDFNVAATDHCSATNPPKKQTFGAIDRLVFVGLYRLFPRVLDALAIVRPGTVIKWHRAGFRLYWRWKSRPRGGRPAVPLENTQTDPRDEHRQPTLGSATDPWKATQARH